MVILLTGASHTGKTLCAQRLLENYRFPYLSLDHLKMGMIRSGYTDLTVYDDDKLTSYLWPVVCGIIKTAVENKQNLIVEGCYVPPDWADSFEQPYLRDIRYVCLIMTAGYIDKHYNSILSHASDIEQRVDDSGCSKEYLIQENQRYLEECKRYGNAYILIESEYRVDITL